MHSHLLLNFATIVVTAYAASSSADNPEAQYLTETDTDGHVTGQPPLATIPAGVSSLPKRKPSDEAADPPVENFPMAGLTSAATSPSTALVTSEPAAATSLPSLVTIPAGLSTAVITNKPSTFVPTGTAQDELKRGQSGSGVITLATNAAQVPNAFSSYYKGNGISPPPSSSIPAMSNSWYIPPTGSAGSAPPEDMAAAATSGPAAGASGAEMPSGTSSMASGKATASAFKGDAIGLMPAAEYGMLGAFLAAVL